MKKESVDTAGESLDVLASFERQLTGTFDSSAQSQDDPTYYDVSLKACSVSIEGYSKHLRYILNRLYLNDSTSLIDNAFISLDQVDEITVKSEIYEIDSPDRLHR